MKPIEEIKICFSIPASPNHEFYSQIAMFRLALDSLGGIYENADLIISLGHEGKINSKLPRRWKSYLSKNVIFHWVSPEEFKEKSYMAQVDHRWKIDYSEYDIVVLCDADVIILKPIDDLLFLTLKSPAITGAIAHTNFRPRKNSDPQGTWNELATKLLGRTLRFDYRYSLAVNKEPEYTFCPFYLNFGFVLFTPDLLDSIKDTFLEFRPKVASMIVNPYFSAQVTLPLAAEYCQIPTRAVGLRYNFPNDEFADEFQKNELSDVRIIHYLRSHHFDRQKMFTTKKFFKQFLSLDLDGCDKFFQEFIIDLTNGQYPF